VRALLAAALALLLAACTLPLAPPAHGPNQRVTPYIIHHTSSPLPEWARSQQ